MTLCFPQPFRPCTPTSQLGVLSCVNRRLRQHLCRHCASVRSVGKAWKTAKLSLLNRFPESASQFKLECRSPVGSHKTFIFNGHFDHENGSVYSTGDISCRNLNSISSLRGGGTESPANLAGRSSLRQRAGPCAGDKNPHSSAGDHGSFKKQCHREQRSELRKKVLWVFYFGGGFHLFLSHFLPLRGKK